MRRLAASMIGALLLLSGCSERPADAAQGSASGLAVLAQRAEGFTQARPGRPLEFPADHAAHPDYRIEWWYLTANLEDAAGRPYGAQWTLFRFAARPGGTEPPATPWHSEQVYMAHLAITTPEDHVAFQRYARGGDHGGVRQAGATAQPFAAWLDDWRLASTGPDWVPLALHARQGDYAVQLRLDSDRPVVPQGDAGFSQKHPDGGGSYYYSQPFLLATGELLVDGETVPVTGQAWLDREWSSQFLQPDQVGWDWFALHLDSGEKLMLFQLRDRGGGEPYRHAVLIGPGGETRTLESAEVGLSVVETVPVANRRLPLHWRIELPALDRRLELRALHAGQWLDLDYPYWEGAVTVEGEGPGNQGRGYMELTGYPENL